ncbi:MAG: FAD-dependent oxidoreductase [Anaerolineae bacterium]
MSQTNRASRRGFLKAAAIAGAGVAASGAFTNVAAQEEQVWDQETDIVVVGSGYAGMCAAIEAADAGAEVIILEKGPHGGGNSILCGGHAIFAGTAMQERLGIEDHPDWLFEDQMEYGEHRAVPELLRTFVDNGPACAQWLEDLGVVWAETMRQNVGNRANRGHWPAPAEHYVGGYPAFAGISIWTVLFRAAEERGIPLLLNHKMTRIIREPNDGPVTGVEVETENGTIAIKARKAVILATGGWKSNVQMRMAWDPRLDEDLWAGGLPYVETTGEGVVAATEVGAGLTDMSFVCELRIKWGTKTYQLWEPQTLDTPVIYSGLTISDYRRVMIVKNDGRRYVNELAASTYPEKPFYEAYLNLKERPRNVWAITDAEGAAAMGWTEEMFLEADPLQGNALHPDYLALEDSIEALAERIGVPAENLVDEVARYNTFLDLGEDVDFGKAWPLYRLQKPPFFAAKLLMLAHDQMGGLRTNTKAQVLEAKNLLAGGNLRIDEEPVIPRLYAAGECVGGYVGAERGHGKISVYMVFGRIAGQIAAQEEPLS